MRKKNYWLLDRLLGMECKVLSRPIDNDAVDNQYIIKSFYYEMDEFYLHFKDAINNQVKTTVRLDEIADVLNLGDDMEIYDDLIKIYTQYHTTYYIHTTEKKLLPFHCDKCGHKFESNDPIWNINQQGEYGSIYDGDWISKKLCDDCVSFFIGVVPSELGGEIQ